ncbi:acyltransferase-domain-containing protein [Amanita rubescens]|nr:acyltransferase-domain-containing protein [Amanita rubescens]
MTDLHSLPISARPPRSWFRFLTALLFLVLFNLGCLLIHTSQLLFLLPLHFLSFAFPNHLYDEGIRFTKGAFGFLLILMCQWFAPTSIRVTFETEGKGKFSQEMIEQVVQKDENGDVVSLKLPDRFVLTANHQIYADWWYMWCLMYFIGAHGMHRHVYITLKKSLQWVPIMGWGMQFFDFIFLARSWASDKHTLASRLAVLGAAAERKDSPLCYILYPEGTLVSKDTRPISKKFADKIGISDMTNLLLPRSLGLHYSLRSLAPHIPDLSLLDITVIYPGIPPLCYGQDYYTLRSIFLDGIPPPVIHMHFRLFKVTADVPVGDLRPTRKETIQNGNGSITKHAVEVDIPPAERTAFDEWLRELWQEKDGFITKYLNSGQASNCSIDIPLKLYGKRNIRMVDANH